MKRKEMLLEQWSFAYGQEESCLKYAKKVGTIHTWNVEEGLEDSWGSGWYEHKLEIPAEWKEKRIWIRFGAVYHDADIFLNGTKVGSHKNSGYTPFELELTGSAKPGEQNVLRVKADSAFSDQMLPCNRSFDWANDGGMIRAAYLYTTGKSRIEEVITEAQPKISAYGSRQDSGEASFGFTVKTDGNTVGNRKLLWRLEEDAENGNDCIATGCMESVEQRFVLEKRTFSNISYWHFDQPKLYRLSLQLKEREMAEDEVSITFGFREFLAKDSSFFLNGEKVRLCGTEWMPGSDPKFGAAEPKEQLEKMLVCLKESNCVFTRFHWQQDEAVFDWCDRHGMLVQEEVPFWGRDPETAGEQQWIVFREQMDEMIRAHRNHPSIIAWGVGNELDGQSEITNEYIRKAVEYTHASDPGRTANYVSNSFYGDCELDGTCYGDIKMINEYTKTWMPDDDAFEVVGKMVRQAPDKPLVISEFGLCEPAFSGGDERRDSLFLEKMEVYRQYPQVAGTINFCLNDYRTQMGEEGEGKLRRRVHGSTDLAGNPKPSYFTVQKECAPFQVRWEENGCRITCRGDLPCYAMHGYQFIMTDKAGVRQKQEIDILNPGEEIFLEMPDIKSLSVYRPNGDFAGNFSK